MLVTILKPLLAGSVSYEAGETPDLPEGVARRLVHQKAAAFYYPVATPPAPVVDPDQPETATLKPREKAAKRA